MSATDDARREAFKSAADNICSMHPFGGIGLRDEIAYLFAENELNRRAWCNERERAHAAEQQRDALAAGLNDIAKGMCPPEVWKIAKTGTSEEFRTAMWEWSQKRAREALSALTGSDKDE